MKLAFRAPRDDADRKFVVSSWLDASRSSYTSGPIPMARWYSTMAPIYEEHMARPGMQTVIAYEKTDPTFLYGFLVADPTEQRVPGKEGSVRWWPALVLFVYTKQNYRKEGVARRLFEHVGIDTARPFVYSFNTQTASRLTSKMPLAKFDPLVVRFPKEDTP